MRKRLSTFTLFALLILGGGASVVYGCSCMSSGPPCQAAWQADAVFVGAVISGREDKQRKPNTFESRAIRFAVGESFRGVDNADVEVFTGWGGGDCGFEFQVGQQYLVYAYKRKSDNSLTTSICSRTRSLSEASEDLAYLRGLSQAASGSMIIGEVHRYQRKDDGNAIDSRLSNIQVRIANDLKQTSVTTDDQGRFSLPGLAPGTYQVTLELPKGLSTRENERSVKVEDKACAYLYFSVESDGYLGGVVTDGSQTPIDKAEILLVTAGKLKYQGYWDAQYTDKQGMYSFKFVPAGKYILHIRYDGLTSQTKPFPPMFYPGVSDANRAAVIEIKDGQRIEDYNLTMPNMPRERVIEGTVTALDGRVLTDAKVLYGSDVVTYSVPMVSPGHFRLTVYEGVKVALQAYIERGKNVRQQSDWFEVSEIGDYPKIKLVIASQ